MILSTKGRLIVAGIGKSANIANKMVATFNSTGQPAIFLHAADAIHGDLGNIQNLNKKFTRVKQNHSTLHLIGLISYGCVHSHIDHLDYLLSCAKENDLQNDVIHAITDAVSYTHLRLPTLFSV